MASWWSWASPWWPCSWRASARTDTPLTTHNREQTTTTAARFRLTIEECLIFSKHRQTGHGLKPIPDRKIRVAISPPQPGGLGAVRSSGDVPALVNQRKHHSCTIGRGHDHDHPGSRLSSLQSGLTEVVIVDHQSLSSQPLIIADVQKVHIESMRKDVDTTRSARYPPTRRGES